ncbi:MAG: hypothetical protein K2Y14_08420 [Burkholderiales bacterium]|nr:hypothetical protein [Burkholderiales bacterium]
MASNCNMENWITKNKTWLGFLFGILVVWIASVIGVTLFKYWYFDLSWSASRISLSNILSLGSAIGAIAMAVFAWMAYRYGIDQFIKQKKAEHKWSEQVKMKYGIFLKLKDIMGLGMKSEVLFTLLQIQLKESQPYLNSDHHTTHQTACENAISHIDKLVTQADKFDKHTFKATSNLAILNLLGTNQDDIKLLSTCISEIQSAMFSLIKYLTEEKQIVTTLMDIVNNNDQNEYRKKLKIFLDKDYSFSKIPDIGESFDKVTIIGNKILFDHD